jgi:alpha-tubulin suppressor-like RCC1 family protein
MSNYYHDDPVEEPVVKRKNPKSILAAALLLFAGGIFVNTTLAANINISTGGKVEFGQGISLTTACSGSTALTVTPTSSFVNTSGSGAFYFNSVTVSGIPSGCDGADFQISAYDSTTSTALPIFGLYGDNKSVATVYNNSGYFQQGFQSLGTVVSSASSAFTVTFKSPLAFSSDAMRLTLQSTGHKDWAEASIATMQGHSCALLNTGAVKCWGSNSDGQLGDGTTTNRTTPVTVTGLSSGVSAISVGANHSCAVLITGAVKCWGNNQFGKLGDGTKTSSSTPVAVSGLSSGVSAIAAGANHTCALLRTGGVKCWGDAGKTGDGSGLERVTPVDVSGMSSGVSVISAGFYHTCALLKSGAVKCWGSADRGATGDGGGGDAPGSAISNLSLGVVAIATGERHNCALLTTGAVKCWGWNDLNQVKPTSGDVSTPVDIAGLGSGVTGLSAGGQTSCALFNNGAAKCWGNNLSGQFGDGTTTSSTSPVSVSGLSGAVLMTNSQNHACALFISGAAKCWGSNGSGQLGDNSTTQRLTPVSVSGLP